MSRVGGPSPGQLGEKGTQSGVFWLVLRHTPPVVSSIHLELCWCCGGWRLEGSPCAGKISHTEDNSS